MPRAGADRSGFSATGPTLKSTSNDLLAGIALNETFDGPFVVLAGFPARITAPPARVRAGSPAYPGLTMERIYEHIPNLDFRARPKATA
jgi:hypothetical protein